MYMYAMRWPQLASYTDQLHSSSASLHDALDPLEPCQ